MFGLKFEKKAAPSALAETAVSVLSIGIALGLGSVLIWMQGADPLQVYSLMFSSAFGSLPGISRAITQMIPLLVIGVGLALSFKAGVWNIGAPGQMIVGAIVATVVALFMPFDLPAYLNVPIIFVLSFAGGAAFAAVCSFLYIKIGLDMVLSTLMLNYIAFKLLQHLLYGPLQNPLFGYPTSSMIPASTQLPTVAGTTIHYPTLIIGAAAVVIIYLIMRGTKIGYEIRVFGENPRAAASAGMSRFKIVMLVTLVSGGLAGLAGAGEVTGNLHMLKLGVDGSGGVYAASYGYTAIIVAALGRNNALGTAIAAFFIGGILVGGYAIQSIENIPYSLVTAILGLILVSLIGGIIITKYKITSRTGGR